MTVIDLNERIFSQCLNRLLWIAEENVLLNADAKISRRLNGIRNASARLETTLYLFLEKNAVSQKIQKPQRRKRH